MHKLKNNRADNLKSAAERLERAATARDFRALAEISLSTTSWTLDAIRGAATAIMRIHDAGGTQ
jgi:hypothetical protein